MRAVFCTNHAFRLDHEGRIRTGGRFESELWHRYLEVFDEIVVVARKRPLGVDEAAETFKMSEREQVQFQFLPDLTRLACRLSESRSAKKTLGAIANGVDAFIVHGVGEIPRMGVAAARSMGKPLALEVVGCPWDSFRHHGTLKGKILSPLAFWRLRRTVARAPFAIYVTRTFLQKRYPCSGRTAAASDIEIEAPNVEVLRARLNRQKSLREPVVIGLIGTLQHQYKGIDVALGALARAKGQVPRFEFRILGSGDTGPWRRRAEKLQLVPETVFWGRLPAGDPVLEWLDDVDLYLQPSFQEGLPRATIEAMSRGCPVLASTTGGIPELLESRYLHKPGEVETLAGQIVHAFSQSGWLSEASRRNFAVAGRYGSDRLACARSKFWEEFSAYVKLRKL